MGRCLGDAILVHHEEFRCLEFHMNRDTIGRILKNRIREVENGETGGAIPSLSNFLSKKANHLQITNIVGIGIPLTKNLIVIFIYVEFL